MHRFFIAKYPCNDKSDKMENCLQGRFDTKSRNQVAQRYPHGRQCLLKHCEANAAKVTKSGRLHYSIDFLTVVHGDMSVIGGVNNPQF